MKLVLAFLLTLSLLALTLADANPTFKSAMVTSSQDVYDLIENNQDEVFVIAFYVKNNNGHDEIIEKVEQSLWPQRQVFDQVTYVTVDATDHYQFKGKI